MVSLDEFMSARGKSVSGDTCFKGYIDKAGGKFNKEARSARFVMSTEAADREGDIIRQNGWQLQNFLKNAPLPVFHNTRSWPVGSWKDVEVINARPKRLEGTAQLLPEGGPVPEIDQAAWMLEHGGMKAVSVGFIPLEMDYIDEEAGWRSGFEIMAAELVECSLVPVPAHPDALMKAAAGDMVLAREFIEEILDTYAKDPKTGLLISREDYEKAYYLIDVTGHGSRGVEELGEVVRDAYKAKKGLWDRISHIFGSIDDILPEKGSKEQKDAKTDEKTPPNDDLERGIALIVKNEALSKRETALIEALQAKGRV
jgi:hypothetical protein